jgi:hypothetical protein
MSGHFGHMSSMTLSGSNWPPEAGEYALAKKLASRGAKSRNPSPSAGRASSVGQSGCFVNSRSSVQIRRSAPSLSRWGDEFLTDSRHVRSIPPPLIHRFSCRHRSRQKKGRSLLAEGGSGAGAETCGRPDSEPVNAWRGAAKDRGPQGGDTSRSNPTPFRAAYLTCRSLPGSKPFLPAGSVVTSRP